MIRPTSIRSRLYPLSLHFWSSISSGISSNVLCLRFLFGNYRAIVQRETWCHFHHIMSAGPGISFLWFRDLLIATLDFKTWRWWVRAWGIQLLTDFKLSQSLILQYPPYTGTDYMQTLFPLDFRRYRLKNAVMCMWLTMNPYSSFCQDQNRKYEPHRSKWARYLVSGPNQLMMF